MLESVIYYEHKCQVVGRFTATTELKKTPSKISYFQIANPKTKMKRAEH